MMLPCEEQACQSQTFCSIENDQSVMTARVAQPRTKGAPIVCNSLKDTAVMSHMASSMMLVHCSLDQCSSPVVNDRASDNWSRDTEERHFSE